MRILFLEHQYCFILDFKSLNSLTIQNTFQENYLTMRHIMMTLVLAFVATFAYAQPMPTNTRNSSQARACQAQVQKLQQNNKNLKDQLAQLRREMAQLQREKQALQRENNQLRQQKDYRKPTNNRGKKGNTCKPKKPKHSKVKYNKQKAKDRAKEKMNRRNRHNNCDDDDDDDDDKNRRRSNRNKW